MIEQRCYGRADLHVHTTVRDGLITPEDCLSLAQEVGLDLLAITDHDEIEGAWEALRKAQEKKLPLGVIVGEEITTAQGHLLGLFLSQEKIPMFHTLFDTVKKIHNQGGLAIVPHLALGPGLTSVSLEAVKELYAKGQFFDGVEVIHPFYRQKHIRQAAEIKDQYSLAAIGTTDDHLGNLGRYALTLFPGKSVSDLRQAIFNRRTVAVRSLLPPKMISLRAQIRQGQRGLSRGLLEKLDNLPVLFSSLVALQRYRGYYR